jgi:hypothetical protein
MEKPFQYRKMGIRRFPGSLPRVVLQAMIEQGKFINEEEFWVSSTQSASYRKEQQRFWNGKLRRQAKKGLLLLVEE